MPPVEVLVEALPQIIAQQAARLRGAESIGKRDTGSARVGEERIGPPVVIGGLTAEERNHVANRGEPQPHHNRIAGRIDELVNRARVEAGGPLDLDRPGRTIAPSAGGNCDAVILLALPDGERSLVLIESGGVVAERRGCRVVGMVEDEFVTVQRHDRRAVVGGDRKVRQHPALAGRDVALPGAPQNRVTLAHQKAVARVRRVLGVVAARGVIEEAQRQFVAAIDHVVEDASVMAAHIDRFQQAEVNLILDHPGGVARRLTDVDDAGVKRMAGVNRAAHAAAELLVGPCPAELNAIEDPLHTRNLDFHRNGLRHLCLMAMNAGTIARQIGLARVSPARWWNR